MLAGVRSEEGTAAAETSLKYPVSGTSRIHTAHLFGLPKFGSWITPVCPQAVNEKNRK